MRSISRLLTGMLVAGVICGSLCEAATPAKKKSKRRRTRTTASKTTQLPPLVLLAVTQPAPTVSTTPPPIDAQSSLPSVSSSTKIPQLESPAPNATATAGQLIISEFRLRGPGIPTSPGSQAQDEFIEIYNASGADHTVLAASGTGYGIAASDGVTRCTIPNGTIILNKSHFLCSNSAGFSLTGYPAGNLPVGTDASYTADIPDNAGIAIFNNNTGGASYSIANRLDAVGSSSEANTTYREGTGYPPLSGATYTNGIDYSFYRDTCGKGGSTSNLGPCILNGLPKDTNDNAADFIFVDTNATNAGAGQRLGTPGPESLFSPIQKNSAVAMNLLDPCVDSATAPNRARDFTADAANNSPLGTLDIRRTITNTTGSNITRLRFRIVDLTTTSAPAGIADLRARTSPDIMVTVDRPPCSSGTSSIPVLGTTLEDRFLFMGPPFQPLGGGFNATLSGQVTLLSALAPGASMDLHFLLGVVQPGHYRFFVNIEVLP